MAKLRYAMVRKRLEILGLAVLLSLAGCTSDQTTKQEPSDLEKAVSQLMAQSGELVEELTPLGQQVGKTVAEGAKTVGTSATDEVQKLFRWEYKVTDLPAEYGSAEIEVYLNGLGMDRWDCFRVEPVQGTFRVFCKRPPKSPLRYMPYLRNPF
jgi:hypothetical protein